MKALGPPLRIAMVAACPFPTSQGSQVLIRELSEALVQRGHEVHVVTYHFGEEIPCAGLKIHRISELFRYNKFRSGPEIRKPILDFLLMRKLNQVVREQAIQIIHAHNYEAPVLSFPVRFLRRVPVVYHSHNTMSDEFYTYFRLKIPQVLARGAAHLMDRFIPRQADFIIAINRQVAAFLIEQGTPVEKIKFIPPGIHFGEPVGESVQDLRARWGLAVTPLIIYCGNLDGYQRLDLLCTALPGVFALHPTAKLVILTGSDTADLLNGLKAHGIEKRVLLVRKPTWREVKEIFAMGGVAVNPRISWSGFPIKLLNYMAAGLPVVAFQGAATPVLHGRTGLLAKPGDTQSFAYAISSLLDDPELAQRMGETGRREILQNYNWDTISEQIERIYYRVLDHPVPLVEVAAEQIPLTLTKPQEAALAG